MQCGNLVVAVKTGIIDKAHPKGRPIQKGRSLHKLPSLTSST